MPLFCGFYYVGSFMRYAGLYDRSYPQNKLIALHIKRCQVALGRLRRKVCRVANASVQLRCRQPLREGISQEWQCQLSLSNFRKLRCMTGKTACSTCMQKTRWRFTWLEGSPSIDVANETMERECYMQYRIKCERFARNIGKKCGKRMRGL